MVHRHVCRLNTGNLRILLERVLLVCEKKNGILILLIKKAKVK